MFTCASNSSVLAVRSLVVGLPINYSEEADVVRIEDSSYIVLTNRSEHCLFSKCGAVALDKV